MSAGIVVLEAFRRADVLDNSVRRSEDDAKVQPFSRWFGILVGGAAGGVKRAVGAFTVLTDAEALLFNPARGEFIRFPSGTASLAVSGNVVDAYGEVPAVSIETAAPCLFRGNRCFLQTREGVTTARISAGAAVTSDNYLDGIGKVPGLELFVPPGGPFTVLGNIVAGGLAVNGSSPIPAPWTQLNLTQ